MAQSGSKAKLGIIFVCTGNTCRSPMAEFMFKDYLKRKKRSADFAVQSAGLFAERGTVMAEQASAALDALGIKHNKGRKAKVYTVQMAMEADMVVAMSNAAAERCSTQGATSFEMFIGSPIPDPYGGSVRDYLECASKMREAFDGILAVADAALAKKRNSDTAFI